MAVPFYYNPATNELELTADPSPLRDSLGTRFGLNEISTARNTLSPIKSYTEDRIDMKPGGIVEPGVEYYGLSKLDKARAEAKKKGLPYKLRYTDQWVSPKKTSAYKYPKKNPKGEVLWYKTPQSEYYGYGRYEGTTQYKKTQEAIKKGLVYDRETDTFREDIRKKRSVLKNIVPPDRYKEIKLANPEMSEIELQKAYEKLTRNQQDGLIYKSGDHYPNRSGVINPSPAKLQELRHASKLPKSFKIIQDAKIKNTQTNKLWTFEEWKNAPHYRRSYNLGLAQDYDGFRAKQKKYLQITRERKGPVGYQSVPNVFRGDKNGLLRWLKLSAEKKNPNYTLWYKDGEVAGVFDKKADTIWRTHNITTEFPNKKHKSIHKHKDFNKVHGKNGFFDMAKKFRYTSPDTVLGRYFVEYGKIPSYSEIYNFLTRPNSKATAKGYNALHKHHTSLVKGLPSKNIQLTLWDRNLNAENLLKRFNTINDPNYKNTEWMDKELKKLNVRMKVSNKMLGTAETTLSSQLSKMKETVTKLFKTKLKENPKLVENLMKHLQIAKNAKGPPRIRAMQIIGTLIGSGAALTLFNKFGITPVKADTDKPIIEPGDEKQEAGISATDVGKGALATAAGYAITHPGKTLKAADKLIAPLLLPLPNILMQGASGDVDPTSAHTWLGPAFWKGAMESLNLTKDKWWHKALRANLKPSTVAKVSGVSGPLLMVTAAIDRGKAMSKTFKEAEELGIDVSQYVDRSSGVIEVTDDLYEEIRKRKSTQGMDYAQGGIASLIK